MISLEYILDNLNKLHKLSAKFMHWLFKTPIRRSLVGATLMLIFFLPSFGINVFYMQHLKVAEYEMIAEQLVRNTQSTQYAIDIAKLCINTQNQKSEKSKLHCTVATDEFMRDQSHRVGIEKIAGLKDYELMIVLLNDSLRKLEHAIEKNRQDAENIGLISALKSFAYSQSGFLIISFVPITIFCLVYFALVSYTRKIILAGRLLEKS